MENLYVFENTTEKQAEDEAKMVAGVSIYSVLKSTNTRHLSLSFPRGESPLEYLNRHWSKIVDSIVKTIGVERHHVAVLGYTVMLTEKGEDKPHAHLAVFSRKSQRNGRCWKAVSRAEVKELVQRFEDEMRIDLAITPFLSMRSWVGNYIAGERNMLADGAVVVRIPGYNLRILRSAFNRKCAAKSELMAAIVQPDSPRL